MKREKKAHEGSKENGAENLAMTTRGLRSGTGQISGGLQDYKEA